MTWSKHCWVWKVCFHINLDMSLISCNQFSFLNCEFQLQSLILCHQQCFLNVSLVHYWFKKILLISPNKLPAMALNMIVINSLGKLPNPAARPDCQMWQYYLTMLYGSNLFNLNFKLDFNPNLTLIVYFFCAWNNFLNVNLQYLVKWDGM